jgi:peptide/nickel transport system permease protein
MESEVRRRPLRKVAAFAITFFLAISLNFLLPHLMPGDPLALIAGSSVQQMGGEKIAELRAAYGLDKPLGEQYLLYLGRLLRGDLGQSYRFSGGRNVLQVLGERFAWTFFLVASSLGIATILGCLLGMWAAWRHGSLGDLGLLAGLFALRSVPPFWLAMILIPIFAVRLGWLPVGDAYSFPRPDGLARIIDVLHHAILPVAVLALVYIPVIFAVMRSSMLGEVGAEYIQVARAKGLSERRVMLAHAMRNALLPAVTVIALEFGQLLGGALLIETVFNYRGLGAMMFEAVKSRDYPLLQGGFLLFTAGVLTINLVTDLLYSRLDPRVRVGGQ